MKLPAVTISPHLARFALWNNPILVKEVRTRMRGNRAFVLLTVHLLIIGLALALIYLLVRTNINLRTNPQDRMFYGKLIFGLIVWMELVMISFTAPALTSGAIALERERQTFDLLKVTLLKARSLVLGKYFSGLVFVFLLLITSLPLFSPAFILGGVVLEEILIAVLILAVSAIAFCAVGLFFSSLFSRTLVATVLAYAFAIFINFGLPIIMGIVLVLFGVAISNPLNLSTPTMMILYYIGWLAVSLTPLPTMIATEAALLNNQGPWLVEISLRFDQTLVMLLPWISYVILYLLLSLVLIWISIQRTARAER